MNLAAWWHFQRARWLTTFNRLESAAAALERVLALEPAYPRALASLGYTYATLGRPAAAIEQFRTPCPRIRTMPSSCSIWPSCSSRWVSTKKHCRPSSKPLV